MILEHLNDEITYKEIEYNPLPSMISNINDTLSNLLGEKAISKKLFDLLRIEDTKLGSIRILPKLHKNKFGVRPIISYKSNPTNRLCILLDIILRPFVEESKSYIKDSQNFIQKCKDLRLSSNSKLFTFDVVSLYTNIEHQKCLDLLTDFLIDKLDISLELNIIGFREILKLVLANNYFSFQKKFYLQIKGIAMGSVAGPSIANIFVCCLESIWQNITSPISYVRFIDDGSIIDEDSDKIESLKEAFGDLKLEVSTGDSVDFLDLNMSIDQVTGELIFKPFFKKTNTFSYLLPSSNHRDSIFINIPRVVNFVNL